jgi:tetratricopeptide (TPR) repeat protein
MTNSLRPAQTQIHFLLIFAFLVALALTANRTASGQQTDERAQALALEQRGENAEAEEIWSGISKADPKNAEALAHIGLIEARQQRLETAIRYYRQASELNPDLQGLQLNLGLALFKAAQFPDAIATLSSEIKKHPGDQRLTVLLGMAHYGMKDYLVAIPYLQRAAESDPQNVTLRMTLAHSCLFSKQYQCVLDVHKEIMSLHSETAEADMLAGEALDELHDTSGAIEKFRGAVLANPKEPNAHFGLGYLLWTQEQWKDAENEFQEELKNDQQHLMARVYLTDAWVQQNDFDRALPVLKDLGASNLSGWLPHEDLGIIYAKTGRTDDAIRELKVAIQFNPKAAETHRQIALLYQSIRSKSEAMGESHQDTERAESRLRLADLIGTSEIPEP